MLIPLKNTPGCLDLQLFESIYRCFLPQQHWQIWQLKYDSAISNFIIACVELIFHDNEKTPDISERVLSTENECQTYSWEHLQKTIVCAPEMSAFNFLLNHFWEENKMGIGVLQRAPDSGWPWLRPFGRAQVCKVWIYNLTHLQNRPLYFYTCIHFQCLALLCFGCCKDSGESC
jgi:hypothetical protein